MLYHRTLFISHSQSSQVWWLSYIIRKVIAWNPHIVLIPLANTILTKHVISFQGCDVEIIYCTGRKGKKTYTCLPHRVVDIACLRDGEKSNVM